MFAIIGKMLDKTILGLQERSRYEGLNKQYNAVMGKIGLTFVMLWVVIIASLLTWYKGLNPTAAQFYQIPPPSEVQKANGGPISVSEIETTFSPRLSTARVQAWLKRSLMEMHSMSFRNYNQVMDRNRLVFRPDTYDLFALRMNAKGGLLSEVKDKSLTMALTPTSEVRLIDQGELDGKRLWKMEMNGILIRTGSIENNAPVKRIFHVVVEEVDPSVNPYGLVISQYSSQSSSD